MGAQKQKWTSEEAAALEAGILKYGAGKWQMILKDPEFSGALSLRSNVDLKDKWRNMGTTNRWGSRERGRARNTMAVQNNEEIFDPTPLATSSGLLQIAGPKKSISRLDKLILDAITNLKEPSGSDKTAITKYIEDKEYEAPPNFKKILSKELKGLTLNGKLIKVQRKYRIATSGALSEARRSSMPNLGGKRSDSLGIELTKSQVSVELERIRSMTAKDAADAAARAVAEAETAIADAIKAAREAEEAEADAEAAQAFAEAALTTLKIRSTPNVIVHG